MGVAGRVAWGRPRSPVCGGGTGLPSPLCCPPPFLSLLWLDISLEKLSTVFFPEEKRLSAWATGPRAGPTRLRTCSRGSHGGLATVPLLPQAGHHTPRATPPHCSVRPEDRGLCSKAPWQEPDPAASPGDQHRTVTTAPASSEAMLPGSLLRGQTGSPPRGAHRGWLRGDREPSRRPAPRGAPPAPAEARAPGRGLGGARLSGSLAGEWGAGLGTPSSSGCCRGAGVGVTWTLLQLRASVCVCRSLGPGLPRSSTGTLQSW